MQNFGPLPIEDIPGQLRKVELELRDLKMRIAQALVGGKVNIGSAGPTGVLSPTLGGSGIVGSPLAVTVWLNGSGALRTRGDVVIFSAAADRTFLTTTTAADRRVIGVVDGSATSDSNDVASSANGRVRHTGYQGTVKTTGVVTAGNYLRSSTTATRAEDTGTAASASADQPAGAFAIALESHAGPTGDVGAFLLGSGVSAVAGALANHDHTATAGDGGVQTNDEHDGFGEYAEIAAPSSPAANKLRIYAKDKAGVSTLYYKDDAGVEHELPGAGSSGVATDTIWDNKGDVAVASGADAADNFPVGVNDKVFMANSGETLGVKWDGPVIFKQTALNGNGNKTTTSTSFVAIDATNLGYLTLNLAVGEVVRCILAGQTYTSTAGQQNQFDFEVDQPTSGDTRIGIGADNGLTTNADNAREVLCVVGYFTATEAGVHGFRPMWRTNAGTATLTNAVSGADDTSIQFTVEKLGAPRA